MIRCTVGVLAYNEEATIIPLLSAVLQQRLIQCQVLEIIVIASGCTDRTVELAEVLAAQHTIIQVIAEPERAGKTAAINHLMRIAQGDVIILVGADTLPKHDAIEQLVRPFADPGVGMTGARVIPLNHPGSFVGFAVQMLWRLHHHLALRWPKLGELVAFRKSITALPEDTATDEVALEALIVKAGLQLVYTPKAIVFNYGPETIAEFIEQRRRIFAGHVRIALNSGYIAASMPVMHLVQLALEVRQRMPGLVPRLSLVVALELWSRLLGTQDAMIGKLPVIWKPILSSKHIVQGTKQLTLIQLFCSRQSISTGRIMQQIGNIPASLGEVIWWDERAGDLILRLPDDTSTHEDQRTRILELSGVLEPTLVVLSYQIIHFEWSSSETSQSEASFSAQAERLPMIQVSL